MKILFLSENFPPERNAVASRVYERACYWVEWGHEVTVLTGAPNFPEGKLFDGYRNAWRQVEILNGIRVVRVKTFIAPNQGVFRRVADFLSFMITAFTVGLFEPRPDVVIATSPQFFTAVAGWALGAVRRLPVVLELADLWPESISAVGAMRANFAIRLLSRLELFLYRQSRCVIALTSAFKRNLVGRGIDPAKIEVVTNGVDLRRYGKRPRDTGLARELGLEGRFVVGYVGTLGMAHALERVLEAAALLANHAEIRFLFVGPGAARAGLMQHAARERLGNVIFMPAQAKESMPACWSLCDLALVHLKDTPLFATVIPSKIFEAMGMGRAIVLAAPEGEAADIVRATGAGIVLPPENPGALARAVLALSREPAAVERLAGKALAAAPAFTRERQARDMIDAVGRALTGAGCARTVTDPSPVFAPDVSVKRS